MKETEFESRRCVHNKDLRTVFESIHCQAQRRQEGGQVEEKGGQEEKEGGGQEGKGEPKDKTEELRESSRFTTTITEEFQIW